MPKKIAYLIEYGTASGGEHSLFELLKNIDTSEYQSLVIGPSHGRFVTLLHEHSIPYIPLDQKPDAGRVVALLKEQRVDCIHSNSLSMAFLSGEIAGNTGIPSITHVRDIMGLSSRKVTQLLQNDCIVAVSKAVKKHLLLLGVPEEKISVIYNGVNTGTFDLKRFSETVLRREYHLSDEHVLIGCIGQICLRKAQDVFMKAALKIAENSLTRFFIIGERFSTKAESVAFEQMLQDLSVSKTLKERCFFTGFRSDIPDVIADLDFIIHPSRQDPLSRVLLESCSMEKPVIATNVGGSSEIIVSEKTGILVDKDESEAIADETLGLLEERARSAQLGVEARKRMCRHFSAETMAKNIMNLYRNVLQ